MSSVQGFDFDTPQTAQPQRLCRAMREVDQAPADERSAIVHDENNRAPVAEIGDPDSRGQGEGAVRSAQTLGIEAGSHRSAMAGLLPIP